MFRIQLLLQASLLFYQAVVGSPSFSSKEKASDKYPLPNNANFFDHDPHILEYNDTFYIFHGGVNIPINKASSLEGPWTSAGTVLDGPSIIEKENRTRPWAPTTIQHNGSFYCFYSISILGTRNSSIGVATTDSLDSGNWTDHGVLINSGSGNLSHIYPYNVSNAIDASFIVDNRTGKPYLNYGSYWHGIFQVPLAADLLSVEDPEHPRAVNLAYEPKETRPLEGPWMSFRDPYYYLWFSHVGNGQKGKDFPPGGQEREVQVGRSKSVNGPFEDKDGKDLTDGGGTVVYASNHGVVYAPGGIGVLPANAKHPDILYYHYLNTSMGIKDETQLGWNYLEYKDGWPVVVGARGSSGHRGNSGMAIRPNHVLSILGLIVAYVLM